MYRSSTWQKHLPLIVTNAQTYPIFLFSSLACTFMTKARKTYVLKLYVAGNTPNSVRALKTLKDILDQEFQGVYALKVIDVLKSPQLAEEDKILATPTLSKILPPPVRKIIGDLSDRERVLIGLDLLYEEMNEESWEE
ncbi:circadian clock protein KaiB [Calothrix sp. NIES-2100]|nr:circadian clock protein KaiB [Calothrix sp. NIES-2100]